MYYLIFGLLYLLSLLPLRVLYLFSDLAYLVVYYGMGYRKDVVLHNLAVAFPQKTDAEKEKIARGFYKNFCDTFIETVKFISADKAFFQKHFTADFSVIEGAFTTGRAVQVHLGHNFNWELANLTFPFHISHKTLVVYLPLKNKLFNRLFHYIRSRFGSVLIAATRMKEEMIPHRGTQYIIGLVADQAPPGPDKSYWVTFFGKPTAFLKGPENAARRNNYPVAFCHFTKTRRGYYSGHAELATLDPQELPEGQLTKMYAQFLEKVMVQQPEMWLWSHRRWKHEWKEEYGLVE